MYLAVDIGATKVLLAVFTNDGKIVEQHKFPTHKTYAGLIKDFEKEFHMLARQDYERAIIAVPGKLDREHGIGLAFGNRSWRNVPIGPDIEKIIGCPLQIENDAKLAALSEAILIKNDFKKVLYVTVSTGISSGLIVNGIIDPNLKDSESGQMWFEHNGKLTQWEDFASGRAIVATYGKRASEIDDPKIWRTIAQNIALGFRELIAIIQPEVIVIGGGVGTHYEKFKKPLHEELQRYEVPIAPNPPILQAKRPEEAVIYGCYHLAKLAHEKYT
jgi:predicted NBD/HSP70 family sugar kinase